jgi:prophage regulatory protein
MSIMDRMLDKAAVEQATSLERKTIYRLEKAGKFPPRRQISPIRVAWLESEVLAWLASRPVIGRDVNAVRSPNPKVLRRAN